MPCVWAMEAARTPWVWTCFCLWMCVLASRARRSGCFELRVSDTLRAGSALGNVSAGSGWTYAVDARLTPACVRRFVGVGADGLLRVAGAPDCACRRGGPAPLRVRLRPVAADRLVWVHFDVFVHGRGCATPRRRKSAHRDVSVSVSVRAATPCVYAGVLLRNFYELLARFVPNARPDCGVGGGAFPSVYDGSLADKCIRPDHLRRGLDVVCEARAQRVTARLQLLPATRRGHRGVGVVDAWAPRSKRAANTAPQFQLPNYQVSVPENEPAGTRVMTLKALDGDDGDAGRVDYDMEALFDSRSNDYFQINLETGSITTLQPLDREVKDTHVFKVIATDNGKPKRSATAYLTITISDTNDHTPLFELTEYRVSIRENVEVGFEVLTIRATDGDAPSNANMVYKIVSEGGDNMGFEIDPKNGLVKIRVRPDRETLSQYQLIVEANDQGKDPGPRSATATVYISVEDENDNYPQFSEKRYVVQVPENVAASSRVAQVKATDMDAGNNAKVHYSIISGNVKGQFYIHSPTGVIDIINPLDYEMIREYNLRIKAQDGGRPPLINGTGLVVVQVMDVNDNAPMFVSTPFQATVLENVAVGYSVIHIQAIDADSGDNSHLEYRLTDTAPGFPFSINNNTGWVTVCRELDRETTEFYTFGVEAVDQGVPAMSSSAGVTVTVLDVNDNVPAFTQKLYNLKINEDAAVGASVLTLTAIDRDANSVVTYQISSGNTRNRFSITSQSAGGLITLALPLDYKQERQFVLTVAASDGTRQDAAQVHINVTDANTHRPVFQSANYQVMFSEDRPVGSTVVVISATDEDTGENARISYVMEDNVPQFKINPDTGAITTQIEIDYEDQASYTLAIIASDNGIPQKSDTTYVEIIVLDANDNAPQFARDIYQGTVFEDAPVYTSVLQIYATDRDSAANGRVSYTFQGGDDGDGDFFIEPYSGIIRTAKKLDRENMPMYNLKALAVDKGVPPLKAVVDIQVSVLDINDNAPVFEKDEMFVYVVENSAVGSIVARISATDPDEGTNAQILFQIVEGNSPEVFQLDMFNGDLIALTDLDYESKIEYTIIVQATSAPLVSRAVVHIHLLDVNDNHPVLPDFEIIFNNYITNRSSSFPAGVIGKVPAQDPDVSDKLHYSFVEGNDLSLLILNQDTGELQLSRDLDNNRPLEATMKIKVTDGVHAVTALCTLRVAIITDDMLSNSITVRLGDMSKERFLSPLLSRFLEGVAAVLSARRDGVFVFNVQNDTHVRGSVLNVTFSALRPPWAPGSEPPGTFLPAEALQERIYLNRTLLAQVSAQHVLPFDDNICLREPCENYMKCVSVLRFDGSAPFVASDTVLFRPIRPVSGLRCRCPTGFTGDYCETEVDLCYSSPCGNRGRCRSREGGYTCQCLEDFTGERCEVNARSGRCVPGVCKNGGRCVDLLVGGFMCQCPPGEFQKPYCEVTTRSFPGQSFVTFRGLRQRFHFTLSFRFATRERNVLLLYNGRFNEKHDFIALELIDEQVQLTFSAGETKTTVSPFVQGGLSDGQWHSVLLRYYNKPNIGRLGVPHGPSGEKVAVVSVDDCDVSMAVRFGSHMGNYTCAAQGTQTGQKKSLDLTGPLLLGGVPNLPEDFPIRNRDFVGCIKDLSIDSEPVDMAGFIANNGTAAGCAVKKDFCTSVVCQNGGVCVNQWNTHMCDCPLGYGGKNCEQVMPSPLHFDGHALLWWREPEVTISVPWYLGLMFRTRQASGTLLQANAGDFSRIHLVLSGHSLRFQVFLGVKRVALLDFPRVRVSDGRWHHVLVELKSVKDGKDIKYLALVSLDYGMFQRSVEIGNELPGLRLRSLFVGGLVKKDGTVLNGLKGCVQGVRMGETSTKLANVHAHQGQKVRVTEGCQVEDSCGPPSVCPLNSRCHDDWASHRCVCNPGFFGKDCVDACLLNPCQHASSCVRQPGSAAGYRCQCGDGFYGKYCQTKSSLPCARGWWGDPVCGPCNCDVNKGFHRNCNKTTGECRCKDNYFRPPGVDSCHPCDCFQVGALSRTCDPASGQCQCRTGVIGRQCNRCDNPYAEVTSSGCTVVYEGCPKAFDAGIWWPKTQFGQPAAMKCPKGSTGTVIRHCSDEHAWLPPDLFNCTSLTFTQLMKEDEELHLNGSRMNGEASLHLARMLRVATEQTPDLHGNDVKTAYSLLTRLLHYESQQQGFDMAATRDVTFHQNIVQAVAAILDHGSGMHWKLIQRTEAGTALLLRRLEEYAQNLARNLWKTYLTPFTVVSPNMIFAVDYVEAAGSEEERASQFPKVQSVLPADLQSYAVFPESLFQTEDIQSTPVPMETPIDGPAVTTVGVPAVVQTASTPISESPPGSTKKKRHAEVRGPLPVAVVMVFPTLGDLLPENYDHDRRSLRLPNRPVINTPVVSTVFYREALPANAPWDEPVTLQYRLLETQERTKPVCVFWNHSVAVKGSGGWSSRGCELLSRNSTHISCQCSHTSSFAVLMDVSKREHGEVLPLKIVTYTTISASLVTLLITYLLLAILRRLRSNLHSIHRNLVASTFLSELVFLFGINQSDNTFVCTVVAILLHYSYMCTFAWMLVEGLHIYRMLTELRNVNHGHMRFYYAMGWGIPAVITGLAVGLDPQGFGNPDFCWLSVHDSLIWSIAGPIAIVVMANIAIFLLAAKASCSQRHWTFEKSGAISALRLAFLLLLLLSATWLLGLMAVNSDALSFHYLFAIFSCLQGACIFLFHCIFNDEVRSNLKDVFVGKRTIKEELLFTRAAMLTRSLNGKHSFTDDDGLYRTTIGESTASLENTVRSTRSDCSSSQARNDSILKRTSSSTARNGHRGDGDPSAFIRKRSKRQESDSDSDMSENSSSYASSHSDDSDDDRRRHRQKHRWNNERTPLAHAGPDLVGPYWPAEPPTASEGEGPGGGETLRVETKVSVELHQDSKPGAGTASETDGAEKDKAPPSSPDSNHPRERRRGILKNKITYPPPVADKNMKNRLREKLSDYTSPTIPPRSPVIPSSPTSRGLRHVTGGNGVLIKLPPPRPPSSPRQQHNGVAMVTTMLATPVVNGTKEHHSSDSDGSNETSI